MNSPIIAAVAPVATRLWTFSLALVLSLVVAYGVAKLMLRANRLTRRIVFTLLFVAFAVNAIYFILVRR